MKEIFNERLLELCVERKSVRNCTDESMNFYHGKTIGIFAVRVLFVDFNPLDCGL